MKIFRSALLVFLFSFCLTAIAEIKESISMKEIRRQINPGDVVIFDLDNTVLEPVQTLGSDQFFSYLLNQLKSEGLNPKEALNKALQLVTPIQPRSRVRSVESITPGLINELQSDDYTVLALTSRPPQWAEGTLRQVASLNIDFSQTAPEILSPINTKNGSYSEGILFLSSGKEKGPALLQLLSDSGLHPSRIIFIDDKLHNVQSVDAALTKAGIANLEFRYGAADTRVQKFDSRLAEFEYQYFLNTGLILSDAKARKLMRR